MAVSPLGTGRASPVRSGPVGRAKRAPVLVWADEQLLIPDELFGAPSPELTPDSPPPASSGDPVLSLPEGIWGDKTGIGGVADPDFAEVEPDAEGIWGETTGVVGTADPDFTEAKPDA